MRKLRNAQVLQTNHVPVPRKTDLPLPPLRSLVIRMGLVQLIEIRVENAHPVQLHRDPRPAHRDPLLIPLPDRFHVPPQGRGQRVERAVMLIVLQLPAILLILPIQNLQLHPLVGGITGPRIVNPQSIVRSRRQLKLELHDVVLVFLVRHQVAAWRRGHDHLPFHHIAVLLRLPRRAPSREILPIEHGHKLRLNRNGSDHQQ